MKLRKWIAGITCACMLLTLSPPAAVMAETAPQMINSRAVAGTPYWEWDDNQKKLVEKKTTKAPQEVSANSTAWKGDWYIVDRDVTIQNTVTVTGNVHLILADGVTLTVNGGIKVADNDTDTANGSQNTLTIYGQAKGSGKLVVSDMIGCGGPENGGAITINGGHVTAGKSIGGQGANVTINAGAVTATTKSGGRALGGLGAKIVINGGTVTASALKNVENADLDNPGYGIDGASVVINDGTVTASGNKDSRAGIKGDTVTIGSGTVIATGGVTIYEYSGERHREQAKGIVGTFSTTASGDAIIIAQSGIEDRTNRNNWKAKIIIDGPEGIFNENPLVLTEDFTIPEESAFVVPIEGRVEIPSGVTLTNKGSLIINGEVDNSAGTLDNQGSVEGDGTIAKKVNQPAPVVSEIAYRDLSINKFEESINGWNKAYLVYDAPTGGNIIRDQSVNFGAQYITEFIDQGKSFYVGKRETDFCYASDRVLWFENTGRHPMPTLTYDPDQGGVVVPEGYKYLYNQSPHSEWPYDNDNRWQDGNGQLVKVEWGKKFYVYQALSDKLNSPIQEISVGTAPNAPQLESQTATTVTLKTIEPDAAGAPAEYSIDGSNKWQDSPTFTGLTPDTEYTFVARYKAHNGKPASANSWGRRIRTEAANYALTVAAPTFDAVTYGDAQPEAQPLTIACTGNIDATIASVTVGADSKFEIVSSQDNTVPMGGENTSWKVQPKAGLDAGTYTETITVTYNDGKTATAEVKLVVNKADAKVTTAPKPIEGLKYTGEAQALVKAGEATGGTMQYSLSEEEQTFKTDIPTGNKAASYRVFYRIKGDKNHNDSKIDSVTVRIGKAEANITKEPKGKVLTYNGKAQALVEAGVTSGGELQYSLKENSGFSTEIPKGTDAGSYTVYYRIVGDSSSSGQGTVWSVDATIDKATAVVEQAPAPKTLTYTGEAQELVTAGITNGCELQYSTDGKTYSKELPKATDASDYTVWYKVEGEKNYTDVAPATVDVTIGKATPQVTAPTGLTATYGQTLEDVKLPISDKGTWAWANDTQKVGALGEKSFAAIFTPTDSKNYTTVTKAVPVTVGQAEPSVTVPTDLTAVYGQTLKDVELPTSDQGAWTWKEDDTTSVGNAGKNDFVAIYTPADNNYKTVEKTVTITVLQAEPSVSAPTDLTATYGQTLKDVTLPSSTQGSWAWKDDTQSVGDAGTNNFVAIYTPADKNYKAVEKTVTLTVEQAEPKVEAPTGLTATYGQTLKDVLLPPSDQGTWAWMNSSQSVGNLGDQTFQAIFTPTDSKNYTTKTVTVTVNVKQAAAKVTTAPQAVGNLVYNKNAQALITAGTAEGGTMQYRLNKDGEFSANLPTGINAGTYAVYYKVVGDANHSDLVVEAPIQVTIAQANSTVEAPTGLTATYGQTLADVKLPSDKEGTWAWKADGKTSVGDAGTHDFVAVYTPTDKNYKAVEKNVTVTVAKANPKVEVPSGLTATYGQTLKDVTLPSNDQGAWAWETPSQSVGALGQNEFQAIYTPKDTANYNTVKEMVEVTVGKATMDVETPSGLTAIYGDTLKDVTLPTSDKGTWAWNDALTTPVGDVGERSFKATFTPKDTNYNSVEKTVTITVQQATPTVDAPTGLTATYGQTLKDVNLPSADKGSWTWKDDKQSVGNVGQHEFVAVYTPADKNYKAVERTVTVTVEQAEPKVEAPSGLTATYGDTLANVKLPSNEQGTWAWKADGKTSVGDAGTHDFAAIYTPTDKNYKAVERTVTVTVEQAEPSVQVPTDLVATYGDTLKNVALPTSDKGSWVWKDGTQSVGDAGTNTFVAVYTPNDKNYKAVDVEVGVTVAKATPQVTAPTGLTASYGQTLADVKLPSHDQGAWTWETPSQSVGDLGEKTFQAIFTPTDSKNYTTVTVAVTVTVKQAAAKVTTAPQAVTNLTYNGKAFNLVTAGEAAGGTIQYRLGETGDYKEAIPQATDAGTYAVYYKVVGDANHSDLVVDAPIQVTIAKAPQTALKAPEAESVTRTAITLKAVADANGVKAEYGIKGQDGKYQWQETPVFENLSSGTSYTFKVRYAESANYLGAESPEAVIRTDRTPSGQVNPPSKPTLPPTVPDKDGGDVSVSPSRPTSGQTVTITPKPEVGMEVDKVEVTDKNGNNIEVTQKPNGDFTFKQPDSEVTINVTFKPESEEGPSGNLPFIDVPEDAWYRGAVEYVYNNGLIMGVAPNLFAPNMTTDRGQLVTMLWRLAGETQAENSVGFNDVPSNAYYAKAVAWAAENGITAGFEDGSFRPTTGLSREQMAALFMKYAQAMGIDTTARADISGYTDVNPNSWSYEALSWAKAVGLLSGVSDTAMAPQATATRAQIAAVLERYCETVAKA